MQMSLTERPIEAAAMTQLILANRQQGYFEVMKSMVDKSQGIRQA